ncbi:MAG TPA: PQQ-binding-like beta-propeller repeat protein [Tepidisphaeraceae bacterium]|jgi:hypothetical protein|nr:PQQ-binding-like beta-propeller repeat protein [Tepidisphaeraceae bacterium]
MRAWIVTLLTMVWSAAVARGDWPMLGHDPARSGASSEEVRPPFERKWFRMFPEEGLMAGVQPVIGDGKVLVGTMRGIVHAIDAESGKDVWSFGAGGGILHACAVAEGKVFFGSADGGIYALNAGDGMRAWKVQTGAAIWNAPVVHEGMVIIGGRDGFLWAVGAKSGEVKWKGKVDGPILCSPAVDAKLKRVYVGAEDMTVYAFDVESGRRVWRSEKLPGVSFRGYHPVIAPDGSVMITVTPCAGGDAIQQVLLEMVKEVFGDFASWRHKKEENEVLRRRNFEQLARPGTYQRELDYLKKRLEEERALRTFFVLDPQSGKEKFVAPIVYAESMNGPASPAVVMPAGKVIVKYGVLLRSRYEHYSPFLNVGYLDTTNGHITPVMDESRTYGWHDSLLLVHDEQSQISVGGNILFNTHQDNVNALDLVTLRGFDRPFAQNVHEVKPGVAASIWAMHLASEELPVGWEWLARGTAVYGGGSAIDVPVAIGGDSFYYLPTHEINSGCGIIAYRMKNDGTASERRPEPSKKMGEGEWTKAGAAKWDWDMLAMARLKHATEGLPGKVMGTRQWPKNVEVNIADAELDRIIWEESEIPAVKDEKLERAVEELIGTKWRAALFPAAKAPSEAYRLMTDPMETIYTLAMAYPHLSEGLQTRIKQRVGELRGMKSYRADEGELRTAYEPAPEKMMRVVEDVKRSETGKIYVLWLWAKVSGDWSFVEKNWPMEVSIEAERNEVDCGNSRVAGLIGACRVARRMKDEKTVEKLLPAARGAMRERVKYELEHSEGGVILPSGSRSIFGRWRFLTPEVARLIRTFAPGVTEHLVDVYVDHHRPTWWLAWNVELLWRNESPFGFPNVAVDVFGAKALILDRDGKELERFLDLPWFKGDEYQIQKMAMMLSHFN